MEKMENNNDEKSGHLMSLLVDRLSRAGNSGGTREPSSQKEFGLAESFLGFEIFTKLNSKMFLKFLSKSFVLPRPNPFL